MSVVFVVETHYEYEGSTVEWAGTSLNAARDTADKIIGGDSVMIVKWSVGEAVALWTRYCDVQAYSCRRLIEGQWVDCDEESLPRRLYP